MNSLPILNQNQNRACNGCKACCYTHRVTSHTTDGLITVTPFFQACQYESRRGCRIYSHRPPQCQTYTCAWLEGRLDFDQRPDNTGLVVDFSTLHDGSNISFVSIMVATPGAEKTKKNRKFIRGLAKTQPVVITDRRQMTVIGPASCLTEMAVLREYCELLREIM